MTSPSDLPRPSTDPADGSAAGDDYRAAFPGHADSLGELRRGLRGWLAGHGVDGDLLDDVILAVNEAAANAIEHGCASDPERSFSIAATLRADTLDVEVRDSGTWRPPGPRAAGMTDVRGRGLTMMEQTMDAARVDFGPDGTCAHLTVAVAPSDAHRASTAA